MTSWTDYEKYVMTPQFRDSETAEAIRKSYKRMTIDRAYNLGEVRKCQRCHKAFPMFEMVKRERRFPSKTVYQWYCEPCNKLVNPGWLVRAE